MDWVLNISWGAFFVALAVLGIALVSYFKALNEMIEIDASQYNVKRGESGRLYYEKNGESNPQGSTARVTERDAEGNFYEINLESGQKTKLEPSDLDLREWSASDRTNKWSIVVVYAGFAAVSLLVISGGLQVARGFL